MQKQTLQSKGETAKAVSLSPRTIDNLVRDGKIPSVRVGTRRLFDVDEVIASLKAGSADPTIEKDAAARTEEVSS